MKGRKASRHISNYSHAMSGEVEYAGDKQRKNKRNKRSRETRNEIPQHLQHHDKSRTENKGLYMGFAKAADNLRYKRKKIMLCRTNAEQLAKLCGDKNYGCAGQIPHQYRLGEEIGDYPARSDAASSSKPPQSSAVIAASAAAREGSPPASGLTALPTSSAIAASGPVITCRELANSA